MNENQKIRSLNAEIDRMLGIEDAPERDNAELASDASNILPIANRLATAGLSAEVQLKAGLRSRWITQTTSPASRPVPQAFPLHLRWVWAALAVALLFAALFLFRQPVLAAVGRLFGYGYIPSTGFIQLDSAQVLIRPVFQEHEGSSLLVVRGLALPKQTTLWIEYSDEARPVDGAWLEVGSKDHIELSGWSYSPNTPGSRGVLLTFPPLPAGTTQTVLALPEGWRLPLDWIPATQSNLPDVRVVPYQDTGSTPDAAAAQHDLCAQQHGLRLCVLAATAFAEGAQVLIRNEAIDTRLLPGDWMQGLVWSTESDPITLQDEQGNVFPLSGEQAGTLSFPVVSSTQQTVRLHIPAALATVDIPDQTIRVDLGPDPQPGQVIPIDADIQVLGATVRFRKATLVGDGTASLRLTLDAEPVEPADGITPIRLEMGKPDRVDDLYGSGNLAGSKDLFVELVRPQGKLTGVLELPVAQATVAISGPFEFSFTLSPTEGQPTPAPASADPDSFSPAPTSTQLALDSYHFTGRLPQPGDLLFTLVQEQTTKLYAVNVANHSQPELIATLPGQVYQIHLHPDRLGADYLAGRQISDDSGNYYRSAQLYTMRFDGSSPRLLDSFPPGSDNHAGTEITATWSFDGRLMAYQQAGYDPKPGEPYFKIGWIDLACRDTGNCMLHELQLPKGLELYAPEFSPQGYQLLMPGSQCDEGGGCTAGDIYQVTFSPEGVPGEATNISNTGQIDEIFPQWNPKTGQVVALCPVDMTEAQKRLCEYDPVSGERLDGALIDFHNPREYQISPNGDQIFGEDINNSAGGKGTLELRLFGFDGKAGPVLVSGSWFDGFRFSNDGGMIAYLEENRHRLSLVTAVSGTQTLVYQAGAQESISWFDWAP